MLKVKFYMMFNCDQIQIRTLEDLRNNFIIEDVLENYDNGTLERWLDVWNRTRELEQVRKLKEAGKTNARDVLKDLIRIFNVESDNAEVDSALSLYDYLEERRQFWEYVRNNGLNEIEELRRKNEELSQENSKLRGENGTLSTENSKLRGKLEELRRKNETLSEENSKLEEKISALKEGLKEIQEKNSNANDEIAVITKKVVRLTTSTDSGYYYDPQATECCIPPRPHIARFVFERLIGFAGHNDEHIVRSILNNIGTKINSMLGDN